jgi:hypothetical protein
LHSDFGGIKFAFLELEEISIGHEAIHAFFNHFPVRLHIGFLSLDQNIVEVNGDKLLDDECHKLPLSASHTVNT